MGVMSFGISATPQHGRPSTSTHSTLEGGIGREHSQCDVLLKLLLGVILLA